MKKVKLAVIPAGGLGSRLSDLGKKIPKGMITLGEQTIIEESILQLQSIGVEEIIIVTGHLHKCYEQLFSKSNLPVRLVFNPYYKTLGSMYSLYLIKDIIDKEFILVESDVIYEKTALTDIINSPFENIILISEVCHNLDCMFVQTNNGVLINMSKDKNKLGKEITGRYTGIFLFSKSLFSALIELTEPMFTANIDVAHGTILRNVIKTIDIHCVITKSKCIEIDDLNEN